MTDTVLVTGGAGYIGSHVAHELSAQDREVVVFDNLSRGHRGAVPEAAMLIEGDLADAALVERTFAARRFDAVIHLASNSLVGESTELPLKYLGENITNASNLIRAVVKHGVSRFVFSSTASVYGDTGADPIDEDAAIAPDNPYGESMYTIERCLFWAERAHGLRSACLRYFNAAGAHPGGAIGEDHQPETHLIPAVLEVALGKRPRVEIHGDDYPTPDGTCIRDYVHVCDLADAHLRVLEALEDGGNRTYNLGSGQGYSVRHVVDVAAEVTGADIPRRVGPRRPGDPAILVASAERAKKELGWRPSSTDVRTIIESAWRWHRDHPDGYPV